jgi:hypothetical protein
MSISYTVTETRARELAGKVASDLRQFSRFYGYPTPAAVPDYLLELEAFLEHGYVGAYKFGFVRNGVWILCYEYTVRYGTLVGGRPGGIEPGWDVSGAHYSNYLTYSQAWWDLTQVQRDHFEADLPFQRTPANDATHLGGIWYEDRTYGVAGLEIARRVYKT